MIKLAIPANAMKTVNHCPACVTGANVPYPIVVETVKTKYSEPVMMSESMVRRGM